AAGRDALLPPGFPEEARPVADRLHRAWNGRSLDGYKGEWLIALLRMLPDATFMFERGIVRNETVALLWRMQGHNAQGRRVRLIGSTVHTSECDLTILDHAAMDAQLARPLIDYSHP
ncbi:MAG: hypothetical protein ACRCY3_09650, partial [Sphingorhabdus sp.]